MEKLNEWFKKFGTIVNIQLDLSMLRAVIQFTDFSAAKAAFNSPDAVFGNRFVKVYWHRVDEIPNPVVGYIGEGGVSSNHTQFVPQQQRQERVMPPPNTPMSINLVADKRAAMLVDLAEQKASLLARQIEHQKALLSKLESPGITDAERSEIMEAIRRSEEMGKSMAVVEEDAIDPALLDKLEMLKQQVCVKVFNF
jgi:RNA-binding protein 26